MPVQLNGVSGWAGRPRENGEVTPEKSKKSNRAERVENLKSEIEKLDAGVARGKLIELRNHIDGAPRNGFLRLDGGGRSGDVSFSTHSWKGWGKSAKGEVTGEALKALFKQAGYDTYYLDKYLGRPSQDGYRGNQRVELGELRAIMTNTGIEVPEENAGKAPDTSWKNWLPVDLKYSANATSLAKIKSDWEVDKNMQVKVDGAHVEVGEEVDRFKVGDRNKIDGTFNTADDLHPEFRGLDVVFAKDITRGDGTSLYQLEGKSDHSVTIQKRPDHEAEQADAYFGFFTNEFPDNPDKAEKWATLASCFMNQSTQGSSSWAYHQEGIVSNGIGDGGTDKFSLKMDPDGNSATLTVEMKALPNFIQKPGESTVLQLQPEEAASFGIDRDASSRSEKLVLRITLDDSQPVGADPNKLLGDLEVISFDYEHHLELLPDPKNPPAGVANVGMENLVQGEEDNSFAWKRNVPLDYGLNYDDAKKNLLANSLTQNMHEPIKKESEPGYREGLSVQFTKDVDRANFSLISSSGEPSVAFGFSQPADNPVKAYNDFFQNEFPNDSDKATRWAKLASCFLNQRVGGANADIFRNEAGFATSQPIDLDGLRYSFEFNPGGESATITYSCSGVPRMIAPSQDPTSAGWDMIAFADGIDYEYGVDADKSSRNEEMKFTIFLKDGTKASDPADQLLDRINIDSYNYRHHIAESSGEI
jgi:hypothetical protein